MRRARTTKQMESRMFDFPDPFRPVIALNFGSKRPITVRCAYDLKPSTMISMIRMVREGTEKSVLNKPSTPKKWF